MSEHAGLIRLILRERGPMTREQLAHPYQHLTEGVVAEGVAELLERGEVTENFGVIELVDP